ncbi:MAG TPA: DOMON-like domain-containing protein [Steroidobacteraceae bacterium]
MATGGAPWSMLVAHPRTPGAGVYGIGAEVRFIRPAVLFCDYTLHADMAQVRIPQRQGGAPVDGLWQHTCFEAFIGIPGADEYYEFNFSPGGDWAAYRFGAYREGGAAATLSAAPQLQVYRNAERLELSATVHIDALAGIAEAPVLRLALTCVVEDAAGELSYWSLRHAAGKPDFHHADGFVLELRSP